MRTIWTSFFAVLLLVPSPGAQDEPPPQPAPSSPKPATTSAPRADGIGIKIPLAGITSENKKAVELRLARLKAREFVCAECGLRAPRKGDCPTCEKPLEAKERPLLSSQVVHTPTRGRPAVEVMPSPGVEFRLSELERSLKELEVTVSRTAMVVVASDQLVFSVGAAPVDAKGDAEADAAPDAQASTLTDARDALTKAFADAEIEVVVEPVPDANEVRVRLKSGSASYGSLAKAAKAGAPDLGAPDLLYRGRALQPAGEGAR